MANETLEVQFNGRPGALLREVVVTGLLTLITAGLYRSWMKTRLRRWYWSSVSIGGQPLEYLGRGSEKFLGFLAAIAFLAVYVSVVNTVLIFASFRLAYAPGGGVLVAILGLVPIALFAQWQARAYVYSRTHWRGIRFELSGKPWGFVWRSIVGLIGTILTLGLLLPWFVFAREKYLTDHTWYGSVRFTQGGDWKMLLPGVVILFPSVVASVVVILIGRFVEPLVLYALWVTIPAAVAGLAYSRVRSFRVLTSLKEADGFRLVATPPIWRIVTVFTIGTSVVAAFVGGAAAYLGAGFEEGLSSMGLMEMMSFFVDNTSQWVVLATIFFAAAVVYLISSALNHMLVVLPMARMLAESLHLDHAEHLGRVAQRRRIEIRGADGLFDALDMGMGL